MKKNLLLLMIVCILTDCYAQIGIKSDGSSPIPSAQLELQSTDKAFYPPRMTSLQKQAIINPKEGAVVYDIDVKTLCIFDGLQWTNVSKQKNIINGAPGDYQLGKITNNTLTSSTTYGISSDLSGNFYMVGTYIGDNIKLYNFDGTTSLSLPNEGGADIFLSKFSSDGNMLWTARVGGTSTDEGKAISVDATGITVTVKHSSSNTKFYNGRTNNTTNEILWGTLPSLNSEEGLIIRYNALGVIQWVARQRGYINGTTIVSDGTSVYVGLTTLQGNGNIILNNAVSNSNSSETNWGTSSLANSRGGLIVKYSISTGSIQWVSKTNFDGGGTMNLAISGNSLYSSFSSTGTITAFNAVALPTTSAINWGAITSTGEADMYLVKMNTNIGDIVWVSREGGEYSERASVLVTDNLGNIYVGGNTNSSSSIPFRIGQGRATSNTSEVNWGTVSLDGNNLNFIYLIKYNNQGSVVWATNINGTDTDSNTFQVTGIGLDSYNNLYVSGSYRNTSLNVYNSKSIGSDVQSLFQTTSKLTGGVRGFIAKFNEIGKGQWLDRITTNSTTSFVFNPVYNISIFRGTKTIIYGVGNANDDIQMGTQSMSFPSSFSAPIGDTFFFKYTEFERK